tara:strand:- start:21138 stop:22802 length:1665 start_codon:yes stop_codon:yes gene_type:complete
MRYGHLELPLEYEPHPYMHAPYSLEEQINFFSVHGAHKLEAHWKVRKERIRRSKINPLEYGFNTPGWDEADKALEDGSKFIFVGGGNRAGKSRWCAKTIVGLALGNPNTNYLCGHSSLTTSIQVQQPYIWEFLPPHLKDFKPGRHDRVTHLNYSQKNGFSDQTVIFPNGSQIWFKNYTQDPKTLEGSEYDMVWLDELAPMSFVDTLPFRLVTRDGIFMLSVTPIEGYTKAVRYFLDGVKVIKWRDAVLLPDSINVPGGLKGQAPFVADIKGGAGRAIWFHSDLNPFSDWEAMKRQVAGKSKEDIMMRVYGWVSNLNSSKFPRFSSAHILPKDQMPCDDECTHYMAVDPAGERNWFMLWAKVDDCGRVFIHREWPGVQEYGDWALEDKKHPDGKKGPAQTTLSGRSYSAYRQLMRELEGDSYIFERFIDPRAGKTSATALKEGNMSVIDILGTPTDEDEGMTFRPSVQTDIDEGVGIINSMLAWDDTEPMTHINEPRLYISSECKNLIWAIENWTHLDRDKGACKDPIDTLRYLLMMDLEYLGKEAFKGYAGGSY